MSLKPTKRAIAAAIVFLVLAFVFLFAPADTKLGPQPVQAVVPPVWLTPAVDLIKYVVGKFKPDKNQQKDMSSKANAMDADAKQLAPFPRFLEDSRTFRVAAIELAQTIRVGTRNEALADKLWELIKVKYDDTNKAFESAFKPEPIRNLITSNGDLQNAESMCSTSLGQIRSELQTVQSSATPKDKQDALNRLLASLNPLTQGAQTPEYVMVQATDAVVTHYAQLATDVKKSLPQQKGAGSQSSRIDARSGRLLPVAFSLIEGTEGTKASAVSVEKVDLVKMQTDIQKSVEPPAWVNTLLEENTSGAPPSRPYPWAAGGFGGGLVIGIGGFASLLKFSPGLRQRMGLQNMSTK